jgi:hypothetical protein
MNHVTQRLMLSLMLSAPALALAQGASTRETPRPQDVDPGVNTSAPSQSPAATGDTPRPQDVDPAVNTSAAAPANEGSSAPSPTPAAAAGASPGAATSTPRAVTFSGAAAAAVSADTATPNPSSAKATAGTRPAVGPDGKPVARGKALDRLELDTTQITGNRELPKVLYIVPWKRSDLGDLTGKPVNSLVDEVLTPVDRDVFKRENRYYRAVTPGEAAAANGASAPSSGTSRSTSPASATESGSASPAARDER